MTLKKKNHQLHEVAAIGQMKGGEDLHIPRGVVLVSPKKILVMAMTVLMSLMMTSSHLNHVSATPEGSLDLLIHHPTMFTEVQDNTMATNVPLNNMKIIAPHTIAPSQLAGAGVQAVKVVDLDKNNTIYHQQTN